MESKRNWINIILKKEVNKHEQFNFIINHLSFIRLMKTGGKKQIKYNQNQKP